VSAVAGSPRPASCGAHPAPCESLYARSVRLLPA
jgi:hypothetical protein